MQFHIFTCHAHNITVSNSAPFRHNSTSPSGRLNKFVRRLHEMLAAERNGGVVEWRRGLLILHSIDNFTNIVLPKYFNTRNFKTFRRQLNYYGFVHLRSFVAGESKTTALWVNQDLADHGNDSVSSVLMLRRVEPNETTKTPQERRDRKNEAASSVEAECIIKNSFDFVPAVNIESSMINMSAAKIPPEVPEVVLLSQDTPSRWLRSDSIGSDDTPSLLYRRPDERSSASVYKDFATTTDYTAANMLLCLSRAAI